MTKILKNKVPISIGIPFNLLALIDNNAVKDGKSRSEYIVQILKDKLAKEN